MSSDVDLMRLVQSVNLQHISQLELSAKRASASVEPDADEVVQPLHTLGLNPRDDGAAFMVRLATVIESSAGRIVSEVAVEYSVDGFTMDSVSERVLLEFANNVAIMTAIPFVRQSIADITLRVFGSPLLMPVMQRGDLEFDETDAATPEVTDS